MGILHMHASKYGDREGGRERKGEGERGKERDKEDKNSLEVPVSHTFRKNAVIGINILKIPIMRM